MIRVIILGSGNVANHLFDAFQEANTISVVQVVSRNKNQLLFFEGKTDIKTNFNAVKDADLYVLAVSDSAIAEVSGYMKTKEALVAHTSGSVPIGVLKNDSRGVFYPLQTFTKGKKVDFSNIPICIEAENENDYAVLEQVGKSISKSVHRLSSEQRQALHLPAVLANNFTNHLYAIAEEICEERNISFELLQPLITETANKIRFLPPNKAQTGPAARNDLETMQKHLDSLKNPLHKKIYQLISESIRESHEKKL